MFEKNTDSFKNLLIILGVIFSIFFFTVVLIFSFSDFAFLNTEGLKIEQRLQYGISAAQTTGTIAAGIAVFFNAYQASRSANAANENAKSVYKNAQAAEDKQITDRFSKAIELLGNQQIEVKLGGIYALEQIAKDAPEKYHWTVMEVLTAFVRENAPLKKEEEEEKEEIPKLRTDIQAALTVIGRRNCENEQENQRLDLNRIDIRGANLSKATLQRTSFIETNLQQVNLYKSDLQGSHLYKADLRKANLVETKLQMSFLKEAKLQGSNLFHANLKKANLVTSDLQKANLWGADLRGANLSDAKNIEQALIQAANGDEYTKLPDYLDRPKRWTKSK